MHAENLSHPKGNIWSTESLSEFPACTEWFFIDVIGVQTPFSDGKSYSADT